MIFVLYSIKQDLKHFNMEKSR
uniref:Uncharacterized protein n=1 Tax=Anguilla anguilla TaxID=7936 RepID=A0A0E9R4D8_ANGAN